MSPHSVGTLFVVVTLALLFLGMPVAFALGTVSIGFAYLFMPPSVINDIASTIFHGMDNFTLLTIPLFILMGEAIGRTRASSDLYESLYRWIYKLPGGLGVANVFGCAIFAAMCGSSTATSAAIGAMGIPEMRRRHYPAGLAGALVAAGGTLGILIPPSITLILYGIVAEQSIGKLFIAGIIPGIILAIMFAAWVVFRSDRDRRAIIRKEGRSSDKESFTWHQRLETLPRFLPFIIIIALVMVALYGGFATPSEVAGVGAFTTVVMVIIVYRCYKWGDVREVLLGVVRESSMIMMILAMSFFFTSAMSYLHISQSAASWLVSLGLSKWIGLFWIDTFLIIVGFFLPPAATVLMITPLILPVLRAYGFDLVWFGINMTIIMEMGLIHPPLGLNLFVIQGIAPDIPLKSLMWSIVPFLIMSLILIIVMSIFPEVALWMV